MGDPNLLVNDIGIPWLSILHLAASRGSSFLVQSPSLFIFHHMALLMMQSLINHNTISWANQLNTNSTYQTTLSLFAKLFNCKIPGHCEKNITLTDPLCCGVNLYLGFSGLLTQCFIKHKTNSWANQLNTNSTYQTTFSLFARFFNYKIPIYLDTVGNTTPNLYLLVYICGTFRFTDAVLN